MLKQIKPQKMNNVMSNAILLTDPKVSEIPLCDCGEPLVELARQSPRIWLDISESHANEFGYPLDYRLRAQVVVRLVRAANELPDDYGFLIKEALRPLSYQSFIFERRCRRLAVEHPEWNQATVHAMTAEYIAPPSVAGHPTGGAFDVTLCDGDGHELEMGCAYDDDVEMSAGRCYSDAEHLSMQAVHHRQLMFNALNHQGFVNYPFEWWHWSYGDRYWAVATQAPAACYAAICL